MVRDAHAAACCVSATSFGVGRLLIWEDFAVGPQLGTRTAPAYFGQGAWLRMVKSVGSKVLMVVVRAVLLALAAGSVVMASVLAGRTSPSPTGEQAADYVCPMHPEATSAAPADCPICGMALESTNARKASATAKASFPLPDGAARLTQEDIEIAQPHSFQQDMWMLAWAEDSDRVRAIFYLDQVALLRSDEDASFIPAVRTRGAATEIHLRKQHDSPARWDDKTALVSFQPLPPARLVPGQTGFIRLAARFRQDLVIPASAVIQSPAGPYVLLIDDDRLSLTPRPVAIGSTMYGLTALLSGLQKGQPLVASRAFLFDAERRLATRTSP